MMISSPQNSNIKAAKKLWKRNEREEQQLFLIEGYRELLRAMQAAIDITTLFIAPDLFLGENEGALIETIKERGAVVYTCSASVFHSLSYRDRPDGLLAIAKQVHKTLEDLKGNFFLVAESIEKPGNLGTMLRSADATGVDGVIVCDRVTDIYNPNVVRASVGTLFTVPVIEASTEETFQWLKNNHIFIAAATPSATLPYTELCLKGPVAIIVGAEQYGLSPSWMSQCDAQVKIPMHGVSDSLNVAMAATLLVYEARRQRTLSR